MYENSLTLETLAENVDIAKNIVEYLNYDDQRSLSRVCKQFENIIINFIWKYEYRHVEVIKKPWINLMTNHTSTNIRNEMLNNLCENWQFFKTDDLEEFLTLNSTNIENLQIWCKFSFTEDYNYLQFSLNRGLPNLTTINYYGVIVTDNDLKTVGRNCTALHTVIMEDCVNLNKQVLVVGYDVKVKTLCDMKNLKYFNFKSNCIYNRDMHLHNYRHVRDILHNLKVKKLYLNVAIYGDENSYDCTDYRIPYNGYIFYDDDLIDTNNCQTFNACEELEIGQFHKNENFIHFHQMYLRQYTNLKKLIICSYTFSSAISINKSFFETLATACEKLNELQLKDCSIMDFITLPQLNVLKLEGCKGLTFSNLKQILNEMGLVSFTTLRTKYSGTFEYFTLAQTLQHLEIDFEDIEFVELFEQQVTQLKTLHWHKANACKSPIKDLTKHMPKLKQLNVSHGFVINDDLLNLKFLHSLTLQTCHNIMDFLKLLQHSTLKHLTLEYYDDEDMATISKINDKLRDNLKTNVLVVEIPIKLFKSSIDFWLDLLSANVFVLILTFKYCQSADEKFLFELINNKKFPIRIKKLKYCGLYIDCNDLRNYFDVIMKKIEIVTTTIKASPKRQTLIFSDREY